MSDEDKKIIRENISKLIRMGVEKGTEFGKSEISYDQLESWVKEIESMIAEVAIDSMEDCTKNYVSMLESELRHQEFLRRLRVQAFMNNLLG